MCQLIHGKIRMGIRKVLKLWMKQQINYILDCFNLGYFIVSCVSVYSYLFFWVCNPCFIVSILAVAFLHDHAGHALNALGSVVLIVGLTGHILQILHVCANEHVPQLHKITVCRVLHCKPQCEDRKVNQSMKTQKCCNCH